MVCFEFLSDVRRDLSVQILDDLWSRFEAAGPEVKGDILYLLGESKYPEMIDRLKAVHTGDYPEAVREALLADRPRIVAMLEEQQLGSSASIYSTLSDADVARYVAFAESPAGRRYHAATSIALDKALTNASVEAGRLLATTRTT